LSTAKRFVATNSKLKQSCSPTNLFIFTFSINTTITESLMNSSAVSQNQTSAQVRFQLNLMKSFKSALLGLASFAVLLTAMSYTKPAAAAQRHYARTNGACLQVRTSPSIYAPVVGCVRNGAPLARVLRYQNGFAKLATGRFVSANWISTRRPSTSNLGIGGTVTLSHGSRGRAVSAVQRYLGVPVTGYYGMQTRNAVRNFQYANGLTADGVVGFSTRRAMGLL
jgi:murein L,D-transpeptidase YcbB/YkuD